MDALSCKVQDKMSVENDSTFLFNYNMDAYQHYSEWTTHGDHR